MAVQESTPPRNIVVGYKELGILAAIHECLISPRTDYSGSTMRICGNWWLVCGKRNCN